MLRSSITTLTRTAGSGEFRRKEKGPRSKRAILEDKLSYHRRKIAFHEKEMAEILEQIAQLPPEEQAAAPKQEEKAEKKQEIATGSVVKAEQQVSKDVPKKEQQETKSTQIVKEEVKVEQGVKPQQVIFRKREEKHVERRSIVAPAESGVVLEASATIKQVEEKVTVKTKEEQDEKADEPKSFRSAFSFMKIFHN